MQTVFRTKTLKYYLGQSTSLHVGILLFGLLGTKLALHTTEELKKSNLKLVESSVRIDLVAMPKLTIKELKSMGANLNKPIEKVVNKVKSKNNSKVEFKKIKKKVNFLDTLKQLSRKRIKKSKQKNIKKKKKSGNELAGRNTNAIANLVLEGNKLSKGTALVGSSSALANSEFESYVQSLKPLVNMHWKLPSYLMNKDLNCHVRIYLSETGKLLKAVIYKTSGNQAFDAKALEAVNKASPFPKLKTSFKRRGVEGDVLLGFPL